MAKLRISEFTFSFTFLHEHVNFEWTNIRAVPCLPSLRLEHTRGYDANIIENGTIFFYQFKMSEYKTRLSSNPDNHADQYYYPNPYFKFYLYPKENYHQHDLLLDLAVDFPNTYYIAPCVRNQLEFSQAFFNHEVMENSRRIQLSSSLAIPDGDEQKHFITYQNLDDIPRIWSNHDRPVGSMNNSKIELFYESSSSHWKSLDRQFFLESLSKIQKIGEKFLHKKYKNSFNRKINQLISFRDIESTIEGLSDVMLTYFNLYTVIVGRRNR